MKCNSCERSFSHHSDLDRHLKVTQKKWACQTCGTLLSSEKAAARHLKDRHNLEFANQEFKLMCVEKERERTPIRRTAPYERKTQKEKPYTGTSTSTIKSHDKAVKPGPLITPEDRRRMEEEKEKATQKRESPPAKTEEKLDIPKHPDVVIGNLSSDSSDSSDGEGEQQGKPVTKETSPVIQPPAQEEVDLVFHYAGDKFGYLRRIRKNPTVKEIQERAGATGFTCFVKEITNQQQEIYKEKMATEEIPGNPIVARFLKI